MLENVQKNLELWDRNYQWEADGDEWQYPANHAGVPYEVWKASLVSHLITPYAKDAHVVEIAPGRGRWSEFIIGICLHATLVDLSPNLLEYCRKRFADHANVDYFLTTGTELPKDASGTIGFVFSYNSFVHMAGEVIEAYLFEIARLLRIGGLAVIHHADVAEVATYRQTFAGQRSAVNRSMVRDFAERSGLTVVRQFTYWDEEKKLGCPGDAVTLLRKDLCEEDPSMRARYTFHRAQNHRDCGEKEEALANYLKRAEMGGRDEEVFVSLYNAAKLQEALGRPFEEVIATYQRACEAAPGRAEALHGAARFCRIAGRHAEGYEIAKRGRALTEPANGLLLEPWIYDYGLLDEFAINAYWAGHHRESLDASLEILTRPALPADQRHRIVANARFAAEKLPKGPNLGSLGVESLIEQHALKPARGLRSRIVGAPRVLVAILAKQKQEELPFYLQCIEALDYPKPAMFLYIRTDNNTDQTAQLLRDWIARNGHRYAGVEFDDQNVEEPVQQYGVHGVSGHIRNISLQKTIEHDCRFYFTADLDYFVRPNTLRELVALNLPIVAPFMRLACHPGAFFSNHDAAVDQDGRFVDCDQYQWIIQRRVRGVFEVPQVHCTYLIRSDVIPELTYLDGTDRYEYRVLAASARAAGILQYFDNRQLYGYGSNPVAELAPRLTTKDTMALVAQLMGPEVAAALSAQSRDTENSPPLAPAPAARQRRIWLYIPYFGAFPNYFQLYLDSLGRNADRLSVFLLTDIDLSGYRVPENLVHIPMTLATLREKAARFIRDELGVDVRPDALLKQPYKLIDFKIMYPALFRDIGERYGVTEDDFVGWGDCDLVYGRLSDFLDLEDDYQIIGGFHGHLTAVRNIEPFRKLFKAVADLPELLVDEKPYVADEIAFRKPLLDFLERNRYKMFYTNRYFCDIVPECFFGLLRQDHAQRRKNFFDAYHPDKDIDHVHYDRDGRLTVVYDDGDSRQAIYCHLQKRAMSMDFDQYENGYYIREDAFSLENP